MKLFHRRRFPVNHYVLVDETRRLPAEALIAEARRRAEGLAKAATGNAQGFTLIHNGSGLARCPEDPHVHIICTHARVRKALLFIVIGLRNLFSPLPQPRRARAG